MSGLSVFSAKGPSDPSVRIRIADWKKRSTRNIDICVAQDPFGVSQILAARKLNERGEPRLVFRNAAIGSTGGLEEHLFSSKQLNIYELDDGLPWDNGKLPGLGEWWKLPFRRDRLARRAAVRADRVIAGNEVLAEWASEHCDDVRVMPTCIDLNEYQEKRAYEFEGPPRLVWIGSSATQPEIERIAPALKEVNRRTGALLIVIGDNQPIPNSIGSFAKKIPWSLATQSLLGSHADIGIMPLENGVYQRAKCGYKLLQYAAAGLPSVASPVGVNAKYLAAGLGAGAKTHDEWVDALVELVNSTSEHRRVIGTNARRICQELASYEVWHDRWDAATS